MTAILAWYASLEWRLRTVHAKVNDSMDRENTEKLIDLKQEPIRVALGDIKDDVKTILKKLD